MLLLSRFIAAMCRVFVKIIKCDESNTMNKPNYIGTFPARDVIQNDTSRSIVLAAHLRFIAVVYDDPGASVLAPAFNGTRAPAIGRH